jgi:hypothetical protein
MTLTRSKTELRGKLSEVLEAVPESYPDVASLTRDVATVMMAGKLTKLEVDPSIYEMISDVDVVLSTDGVKVSLEIVGEKDE